MLGGRLGATTHDRLLPRHAPRSDDTGSTRDPEAGDPASSPPHCLTGAFADPAPETSFGASCFRAAYPVHMALMTLWLISDATLIFVDSDALHSLYVAADAGLLVGRLALHRRDDHVAAQRVGGIVWTCIITGTVLSESISILITEKRDEWCAAPHDVGGTLSLLVFAFAFAYLNSSHGLRFWHKTALWAGLLLVAIVEHLRAVDGACTAPAVCELVLGHCLCHVLELHARRAFFATEELQEAKERLVVWRNQLVSAPSSSAAPPLRALEEPAASSPPHRLTGAFADPAREASFGASCFRAAYPVHMALMTLGLISDALWFLLEPDAQGGVWCSADAAMLLGRVALQRMDDQVAAQRVGGIAWTCYILAILAAWLSYDLSGSANCSGFSSMLSSVYGLVNGFFYAYVNSSHGLGFWHKNALMAAMLGTEALGSQSGEDIGCVAVVVCELVLSHGLCHALELHARHAFFAAEELREARERLAAWQAQAISVAAAAEGGGPALQTDGGGGSGATSDATSDATSSGPFAAPSSLWSGWSAAWSDPDLTYQQKLSRVLGGVTAGLSFTNLKQAVREAKAYLAELEASKARRRAAQHGKAHGRLVWKLLRRAQRDPASPITCVPRDALRIIVDEFIRAEVARLEVLYAERLAAGATSYRG